MVISKVSTLMKGIASKVLDLEDERMNEQFKMLKEAARNNRFDLDVAELKQLVKVLKAKHAVDSIIVAYNNGSLLISSNGPDLKDAITGSALLSYIRSEIPKSEAVFIKKSKAGTCFTPKAGKFT